MNHIKKQGAAFLQAYCREHHIELRENEPMSGRTTFKIGGPADWFALPDTEEKLIGLLGFARSRGVRTAVVGRGSNLLAPDAGFRGLVVSTARLDGCRTCGESGLEAGGGMALSQLASRAAALGLAGLEFAQGIPGSVGGAVAMNAGAYDGEMSFAVQSSRVLTPQGGVCVLTLPEHRFGYRTSRVKETPGMIVLSTVLSLKPGKREEIEAKMADFAARRRDKQPLQYPSAGSAYKRPQGYFAGQLIEQCGLKGFQIGGARVSDKHAGFIVNAGGATAGDVLRLMEHIEKTVFERTGVRLEREICVLD